MVAINNVPPLPGNIAIVDPKTGNPSTAFMRYFNDTVASAVNALAQTANAQSAADAAILAAAAANAAADTATGAAGAVTASSALASSSTTGLAITATDAGTSVTVAISAHTRVYGDGTSVAVAGGSITGLSYSTSYWLVYTDPTRAGGAVTYAAATTVQGNGVPAGQHFVGSVATPAAAAPPSTGNPVLPPGANIP